MRRRKRCISCLLAVLVGPCSLLGADTIVSVCSPSLLFSYLFVRSFAPWSQGSFDMLSRSLTGLMTCRIWQGGEALNKAVGYAPGPVMGRASDRSPHDHFRENGAKDRSRVL
jgi:hypothetical protein